MAFFSIVLATRNRPELFDKALQSVLSQSFEDVEIIVVNDGSSDEFRQDYEKLEQQYQSNNIKFFYLPQRSNGHGQSYSINTGASLSSGKYIGFLDDDDFWIDDDLLASAYRALSEQQNVDVYYSNQKAFYSTGERKTETVWIEDLAAKLPNARQNPVVVGVEFLMKSKGFAHLNCTLISRKIFQRIGGMDEGIRYECDRDFYLRTLDASSKILYNTKYVSLHNIPDPKNKDNMSTLVSNYEKRLFQLTVFEKCFLQAKSPSLVDHARKELSYCCKHIAVDLMSQLQYKKAWRFSTRALSMNFGFKWFFYTLYIQSNIVKEYVTTFRD